MKKIGVDVVLFVLATVLGSYLAITVDAPTTSEMQARKDNLFPAFSREGIERLVMESGSGTIVLTKDERSSSPARYFLGEAGGEVADEAAVLELLSALEFATWERRVSNDADLESLGLTEPRLTFRMLAGSRSYRLLFGKPVPHESGHVYARIDGPNVDTTTGTLDEGLLGRLLQGEQVFRGRALFPLAKSATARLDFETEGEKFSLVADDLGYLLVSPERNELRADRRLVDLIFFQMARATISRHAPRADSPRGELEGVVVSQFDVAEKRVAQVRLGGPCPGGEPGVFASRLKPHPVSGCVPVEVGAALRVRQRDLIERSAVPLNLDEVDHVVVENGQNRLDLIRRDAAYFLVSREQNVQKEAGDDFLRVFCETAWELAEDLPEGTAKVGEVILKGQAPRTAIGRNSKDVERGETEITHEMKLVLYERGEEFVVERLDDGAFLRVPSEVSWALTGRDGWARNRDLSSWEANQIESVQIVRSSGESRTIVRKGESFVLGSGQRADPGFSDQVASALSSLRADRFVRSAPRPKGAALEVHFVVADERHTLWIDRRVRGGHLAWATFADGTFVLPPEIRETLSLSLFDRGPAVLLPGEIESLDIEFQGRAYRLERHMGQLVGRSGAEVDGFVEALERALMGLEVAAAVPRGGVFVPPGPPVLRLSGTLREEGGERTEDSTSFELTWAAPTSYEDYPMVPVTRAGDELVYLLTRKSAENLLDLL